MLPRKRSASGSIVASELPIGIDSSANTSCSLALLRIVVLNDVIDGVDPCEDKGDEYHTETRAMGRERDADDLRRSSLKCRPPSWAAKKSISLAARTH